MPIIHPSTPSLHQVKASLTHPLRLPEQLHRTLRQHRRAQHLLPDLVRNHRRHSMANKDFHQHFFRVDDRHHHHQRIANLDGSGLATQALGHMGELHQL